MLSLVSQLEMRTFLPHKQEKSFCLKSAKNTVLLVAVSWNFIIADKPGTDPGAERGESRPPEEIWLSDVAENSEGFLSFPLTP